MKAKLLQPIHNELESATVNKSAAQPALEGIVRTRDMLEFHVGGMPRLAKASLSRLLQQFQSNRDFVILTSYDKDKPERENIETFQKFPGQYRARVGTKKVGAYELVGHWQEEGEDEELERSWFFLNGDPSLSSEDFIAAGKALAGEYKQTALIVSRQGVITLESPEGDVMGDLTSAGAIENALQKLMKARTEFAEGRRPGIGYSELKRMKKKKHDSTFVLDGLPDRDEVPPAKEAQTASFELFVGVPRNMMAKQAFAYMGMNHPGWNIREPWPR